MKWALALALVAAPLYAQVPQGKSLSGLDALSVDVLVTRNGEIAATDVRSAVEIPLRAAGVRIVPETLSFANFTLSVSVTGNPDLWVFTVDTYVIQQATLNRNPKLYGTYVTWKGTGRFRSVGVGTLRRYVLESVDGAMGEFVNAFLTANPRTAAK